MGTLFASLFLRGAMLSADEQIFRAVDCKMVRTKMQLAARVCNILKIQGLFATLELQKTKLIAQPRAHEEKVQQEESQFPPLFSAANSPHKQQSFF